MDITPQYTFAKNGAPVGVFISIEEWTLLADTLHLGIPDWQREALDAEIELIDARPDTLLKWDDIKGKILSK